MSKRTSCSKHIVSLVLNFTMDVLVGQDLLINERSAVILRKLGRVWQDVLVEALVEHVELRRGGASHVKPPVASEPGLREDRTVGAQEGGLPAVQVAVVPHLEFDTGSFLS